jgi:hypothetical protein
VYVRKVLTYLFSVCTNYFTEAAPILLNHIQPKDASDFRNQPGDALLPSL